METTRNPSERPTERGVGRLARSSFQRVTESEAGLLLAIGIAALVRVLGLFTRPIWYDEAFAILFSGKGPAAMVVGTLTPTGAGAADIHPLGYYTMLWLWVRAFGDSVPTVRGLSILAGLATIAVGYALTRSLIDKRAASVAALLLALAPFQVHYSQEIRMYSFLGLWLTLAAYCYRRAIRDSRWPWWIGFSISAALAQYTHNLAAIYLVALALWPVLRREWAIAVRVALAGLVAVLLYMPWLIHVPSQIARVSQAYWVERPPLYRLLLVPVAFVTNLPAPPALMGMALFASLGVVALGVLQMRRKSKENPSRDQASQWLLYMTFAPPLIMFLFSQWVPVYVERALIASGVTFCIWLACQITAEATRAAGRWMLAALTALGFVIGLWQHLTYRGFPYAPYESIAAEMRGRIQPGDKVIHSSKLSFLPSRFFDLRLPATFIADPIGSSTDTLAPSTQEVLGIEAARDMEEAAAGASRVWFVLFDQSNQEYVQAGYPYHPHLAWMLTNYRLAEAQDWDDLTVYLFTGN